MPTLRRAVVLASLGLSLLAAPVAHAQDQGQLEEARKLYTDATKSFKDKHYKEAALGFEAASKLHPHAVALYTAAQAWEAANEPARAADDYSRSLDTPKLSESQAARARERLDALEQSLGTVVVMGDDTTRVQLDDHIELPAPARFHGKAGDHTLLIIKGDGNVERRKVSLAAGASVEVDTNAPAEAATAAPTPTTLAPPQKHPVEPEPSPSPSSKAESASPLKTVGFVVTGVGVGALGGAVLLGLSANSARDAYNGTPSQGTYDHAKSLESTTNVMFIAGGVLTAAGVGLVIWQSTKGHEQKQPGVALRAAPGGLWAEGSF